MHLQLQQVWEAMLMATILVIRIIMGRMVIMRVDITLVLDISTVYMVGMEGGMVGMAFMEGMADMESMGEDLEGGMADMEGGMADMEGGMADMEGGMAGMQGCMVVDSVGLGEVISMVKVKN